MAYAPCKNPNCKSYGQPHPNCRCYGAMADGGVVKHFCESNVPHGSDCEYFADGGDVVPDDQVEVQNPGEAYDEIPGKDDGEIVPDDQVEVHGHPDDGGDVVPDDQVEVSPQQDFESAPQQIVAGMEGIGQGVGGPLFTAVEQGAQKLGGAFGKDLGFSDQEIAGRREANPGIHTAGEMAGLVGSIATGEGILPVAAKVLSPLAHAEEIAALPKLGAAFLRGAITNGLINVSDNTSKWMLGMGDQGDPVAAVLAGTPAAALIGGAFGTGSGIFGGAVSKASEYLPKNIGYKLESALAGIATKTGVAKEALGDDIVLGETADNPLAVQYDKKWFEWGQKLFDKTLNSAVNTVAAPVGAMLGGGSGVLGHITDALIGFGVGKGILKAGKETAQRFLAPAALRVMQSDTLEGMFDALDHASTVAKGVQAIDDGVDRLFDIGAVGTTKAMRFYKDDEKANEKERAKLDDIISNGGYNQNIQQQIYQNNAPQPQSTPEGYADGGEVKPSNVVMPDNQNTSPGIAAYYPEQNMMLSAAKGRISNYLMGLKPNPNPPKLAFDDMPDTREQQRSYVKALDIANQPLSILKDIKSGTVEPDQVKHFNSMYPELNKLLQKQMTEKILQMQIKNIKPPSMVRQGLSMFMGAPLSGEFKPQNIQAAQSAYAGKAPPPEATQPKQKSQTGGSHTAALSKSDRAYLTNGQALVRRQQKI